MATPINDDETNVSGKLNREDSVSTKNTPDGISVSPTNPSQSRCAFLKLPLELRLEVYQYARQTNTSDESNVPVVKVGERRILRASTRNARKNLFTIQDVDKHHLGLGKTCSQVSSEIRSLLPNYSFYFTSADVLGSFLGDRGGMNATLVVDERALNLLCAAPTVTLGLNHGDLSRHQLWRLSRALPRPFGLDFVNEGGAEQEFQDAMEVCSNLMARFFG